VVGTRVGGAALALLCGLPQAVAGPLPPGNTGRLCVTSQRGDAVSVYTPAGRWTDLYDTPELARPGGIVIGPGGRAYVANGLTNEVLVLDEGQCTGSLAHEMLDGPAGLAFGAGDVLWICCAGNDRVVGLRLDGSLAGVASARGLRSPTAIAVDGGGRLYVTGRGSRFVFIFDAAGRYLDRFTGGGLLAPAGITRSRSNLLYVSDDRLNRIIVFKTDGEVQTTFDDRVLVGPGPLAFDDRGLLYVASTARNAVIVLDTAGHHLRTITGGRIGACGGLAFVPTPFADVDDDGGVDLMDFAIVAANWGACESRDECPGDITRNGTVDFDDVYLVVAQIR